MANLIDRDSLVAKIEKRIKYNHERAYLDKSPSMVGREEEDKDILSIIDTLEVQEGCVWKTVDNINPPQADRSKIYCVLSKNKYLLARVINHPHDELLQWCCTEFPFRRYDMCEGDKYMVIN